MSGSHKIGYHVFVKRIDRYAEFLGEFSKGFADSLDGCAGQVLEFAGKVRVGVARFVIELCNNRQ